MLFILVHVLSSEQQILYEKKERNYIWNAILLVSTYAILLVRHMHV